MPNPQDLDSDLRFGNAKHSINELFNDSSVSPEHTVLRLKALEDEINLLLQCLRDDGVDVDAIF